ncbi:MAG: DUF697 domain-containing protein [Rhizonema sp. PD38]|nr:DUF697 domain-containing protein [Rhizonema sp. PD38]
MVVKLQRPILVGGLGLSFCLWMFQSWHHYLVLSGELSLLSLLAVGGGLWLLKQKSTKEALEQLDRTPVDRATVEGAIALAEAVVTRLAQEAENHIEVLGATSLLQEKIVQLTAELDRKEIDLAVTGGKSVGKTALIRLLKQNFSSLQFHETLPLFTEAGEERDATELEKAIASDFILFLIDGDLIDSEFQIIQQIKAANQSIMLVLNKQDQYLPDERLNVFSQLKQRLQGYVVATTAYPLPIKVRKHLEDGSVQEWLEQPAPDIQQLTSVLGEILLQQGEQLVWATTRRKALLLKAEAKDLLNGIRRDRSLQSIEQYQWIAAAAAFANPVPTLDILATAAINAQMVMDLGAIYQQKFSLAQAQTVAGTMGSLMLKLGLVELSSQAIATILKSNAVTFVAGGAVQGVSAAYLTRIAGLTLVEYFQQQEIAIDSGTVFNPEKLRQTLLSCFQQNQQISLLQGFVKQSVKRLLSSPKPGISAV